MKSKKIYLQVVRLAENTIFAIDDKGVQKAYYEPIFQKEVAYASGQQVKRNILSMLGELLDIELAPVTFNYAIGDGKKGQTTIKNKQPMSLCDPTFPDQLFGGYMLFESVENSVAEGEEKTPAAKIKRGSPLSISHFTPLHPLLCKVTETNLTFDRPDKGGKNPVQLYDKKKNLLSAEDAIRTMSEMNRNSWASQYHKYKIATGMFKEFIAIDLETLFSVNINDLEPSITEIVKSKMLKIGYTESENRYGKCLVAPDSIVEEYASALAHVLIHWEINSNQARSYSPLPILAIAMSHVGHHTNDSFYCRLSENNNGIPIAEPRIDFGSGANISVSNLAQSYFKNTDDEMKMSGINNAELHLAEMIKSFDYANQKYK